MPNVVGKTKNKNTLINNFADAILTGTSVKLFKNSTRYIIGVDDVVNYFHLTKNTSNCIINLNFNINYTITEIWKEIELVLDQKGKAIVIDQGSEYKIDNSLFISKLEDIEIPELNEICYIRKTLQKYLSK